MAENSRSSPTHARPLSPFLSIYRWPITMATSIAHRATGIAISAGMIVVAWGLIAVASGPEMYRPFVSAAANPVGLVVLFGLLWAFVYHLLNGIRHLAWDFGYGFAVRTANRTGVLVIVLSILLSILIFVIGWSRLHGGAQP